MVGGEVWCGVVMGLERKRRMEGRAASRGELTYVRNASRVSHCRFILLALSVSFSFACASGLQSFEEAVGSSSSYDLHLNA